MLSPNAVAFLSGCFETPWVGEGAPKEASASEQQVGSQSGARPSSGAGAPSREPPWEGTSLLLFQLFDVALQNDQREDGCANAPLQLRWGADLHA